MPNSAKEKAKENKNRGYSQEFRTKLLDNILEQPKKNKPPSASWLVCRVSRVGSGAPVMPAWFCFSLPSETFHEYLFLQPRRSRERDICGAISLLEL